MNLGHHAADWKVFCQLTGTEFVASVSLAAGQVKLGPGGRTTVRSAKKRKGAGGIGAPSPGP